MVFSAVCHARYSQQPHCLHFHMCIRYFSSEHGDETQNILFFFWFCSIIFSHSHTHKHTHAHALTHRVIVNKYEEVLWLHRGWNCEYYSDVPEGQHILRMLERRLESKNCFVPKCSSYSSGTFQCDVADACSFSTHCSLTLSHLFFKTWNFKLGTSVCLQK